MAESLAQRVGSSQGLSAASFPSRLALASCMALWLPGVFRSGYLSCHLYRFALSAAPHCSWTPTACSGLGSAAAQQRLGPELSGSEVDLTTRLAATAQSSMYSQGLVARRPAATSAVCLAADHAADATKQGCSSIAVQTWPEGASRCCRSGCAAGLSAARAPEARLGATCSVCGWQK